MKRAGMHVHTLGMLVLVAGLSAACAGKASPAAERLSPATALAAGAPAPGYRYTVIHVPGAAWTQAYRMNAQGDLVGSYQDATGTHGFLLRGRSYRSISVPTAIMTHARGINERGDVVGYYVAGETTRGFILSDGRFTTLQVPATRGTRLWDITGSGEVSGEYQAVEGGPWHAFTWREGEFTLIAIPDATMSAGFGINVQGDVVGHYQLPSPDGGVTKMLGFVWRDGVVTQLDHPVPNLMSCAFGISADAVIGHYQDLSNDVVYGFVWQDGDFTTTLRVPDAAETYPISITPAGTVAGYHRAAAAGGWRGFVAEPLNGGGR
jgi:hypothetical protein